MGEQLPGLLGNTEAAKPTAKDEIRKGKKYEADCHRERKKASRTRKGSVLLLGGGIRRENSRSAS